MLSKFKITSPRDSSFHNRTELIPLTDIYESEIRRLHAENEFLKMQYNSVVAQLNAALVQLQQSRGDTLQSKQDSAETACFYNTKTDFWQMSRSGRCKKKRRIRELVLQSIKGLREFVPIEVSCLIVLKKNKNQRSKNKLKHK